MIKGISTGSLFELKGEQRMKRGDRVELKMQKTLCEGVEFVDAVYSCQLLQYDDKRECLYLLSNSNELTVFSLDAIYVCEIQTDKGVLQCTGRIKERYCNAVGSIVNIQIINGFFKV